MEEIKNETIDEEADGQVEGSLAACFCGFLLSVQNAA